jgi:hypothetical protein
MLAVIGDHRPSEMWTYVWILLFHISHSTLLDRIGPFENTFIPFLEPSHHLPVDTLESQSSLFVSPEYRV